MRSSLLFVILGVAFATVANTSDDLDLVLYGADGCVGHFAASHLAQQTGLKWAIAGRTQAHLEALAEELSKQGGNSSKPEIIVAALDGKTDPKAWVKRAKAVVTAAGPFSIHGGELLVKACADNGVHYSDTSDEFYWQRKMVDLHDTAAQQSGAKIVLSSGFCVLAGDLGSQLALARSGTISSEAVSLDAWLETYNGGLSAGVINTGKAIANASYPKEWDKDPYVLVPDVDPSLRMDTVVEGMSYPKYVSGEGLVVSNIFGPYDARLLRRTFAHLKQKVHLRVGATAGMYPKWTAFLASHPGSWSKLTQCPSEAVYEGGSWAYRFKVSPSGRSTNLDESMSSEILLSGSGDPGYRFTALGLAEAGLCLAGKTTGCLTAAAKGGVYTSMSAMDASVMAERLQKIGLLKVEHVREEGKMAASTPSGPDQPLFL